MLGTFIENPTATQPIEQPSQLSFATGTTGSSIKLWLVVFLGVLIAMWALPMMIDMTLDEAHTRVSLWNFINTGISAIFFIVLAKIIFNRYQIAGLTEIINTA